MLGKKIGKDGVFAENICALIETPGFLNSNTDFQNLQFLAEIQNRIGKKEIQETMEETGLDWKSKKRVGKYSLGMKQRLGIAQAIMEDPKILLLASHIKEDLEVLCDEVYEIQASRLRCAFLEKKRGNSNGCYDRIIKNTKNS